MSGVWTVISIEQSVSSNMLHQLKATHITQINLDWINKIQIAPTDGWTLNEVSEKQWKQKNNAPTLAMHAHRVHGAVKFGHFKRSIRRLKSHWSIVRAPNLYTVHTHWNVINEANSAQYHYNWHNTRTYRTLNRSTIIRMVLPERRSLLPIHSCSALNYAALFLLFHRRYFQLSWLRSMHCIPMVFLPL